MSFDWKKEIGIMSLEDAINNGKIFEIGDLCRLNNISSEQTLEIIALTQIQWLQGRGNFTDEGIATWNSQEIRSYLAKKPPHNAVRLFSDNLVIDSQLEAVLKIVNAMKETIGYHVEMGDSKGYSPGRRAALDIFLSESMEIALERYSASQKLSNGLAHLIGTIYHCICVTTSMEIIPLNDFQNYYNKMEKWKHILVKAFQEDRRNRGDDSMTFNGFGEFIPTIQYLDINTIEKYQRLNEVVEATLTTAKEVYGDIKKVSEEVGSWLSYIPDDKEKKWIRQNLIDSYGLNVEVVDANTTPTEVYLDQRVRGAIKQWMDYGSESWLDTLKERVKTEGHKVRVAKAMLVKLYNAESDFDVKTIERMVPSGSDLYNEQIVSDGFKKIVIGAFQSREFAKLKLLAPIANQLYKGNDIPDLKALHTS